MKVLGSNGLGYKQSDASLGEEVGGELGGGLHVAFDFDLSLHEGVDVAQLTGEHGYCVLVTQVDGGVRLSLLALEDASLSVFEIDGELLDGVSLLLEHFQQVDEAHGFDHLLSPGVELGLHGLEGVLDLKNHLFIYLYH